MKHYTFVAEDDHTLLEGVSSMDTIISRSIELIRVYNLIVHMKSSLITKLYRTVEVTG